MKTALAYIRISDEEQSHFSIEGQQRAITEYCERQQIQIADFFIDNGFSAKNFNRPAWIKLKHVLKERPGKHTYLIVYKYDRLIRNAMEGLAQLYELEKSHQMTIISVCENLGLNPHSPYFKKVRADILVNAEFERDVISHRVRFGMNQALRSGRYLHQAPFGYLNSRDQENKPLLIIDEEKAPVVQLIFDHFLNHVPVVNILKIAKSHGFHHTGKSAIEKILRNPVYAGLIRTTAFEDQPSSLVHGIHEPIIAENIYWAAQQILDTRTKVMAPKVTSEHLPLRGILMCENGHQFTGCMSTGKSGNKWPYYKCNRCGANISAGKAHEDLHRILQSLSLLPEETKELLLYVKEEFATRNAEFKTRSASINRKIAACEKLIRSAEEKYLRDTISQAVYERTLKTNHDQIVTLRSEMDQLQPNIDFSDVDIIDAIDKMASLQQVYDSAPVEEKHIFLSEIFPRGLIRDKKTYRTPEVLPILALKDTSNLPLIITGEPSDNNSPLSGPQEFQIKHFFMLLNSMTA